jgi:hypothetical protein
VDVALAEDPMETDDRPEEPAAPPPSSPEPLAGVAAQPIANNTTPKPKRKAMAMPPGLEASPTQRDAATRTS